MLDQITLHFFPFDNKFCYFQNGDKLLALKNELIDSLKFILFHLEYFGLLLALFCSFLFALRNGGLAPTGCFVANLLGIKTQQFIDDCFNGRACLNDGDVSADPDVHFKEFDIQVAVVAGMTVASILINRHYRKHNSRI